MSAALQHAPRSRVLVVDDDPEIVTFLATLLELEGIESQVATSAAAALSLLERAGAPSLVLLDIAMPDRDGLDLCRELKKDPRTRDVPVFVVSARPGKDVVERCGGARRDLRIDPFELEQRREEGDDLRIVVHHEDACADFGMFRKCAHCFVRSVS